MTESKIPYDYGFTTKRQYLDWFNNCRSEADKKSDLYMRIEELQKWNMSFFAAVGNPFLENDWLFFVKCPVKYMAMMIINSQYGTIIVPNDNNKRG